MADLLSETNNYSQAISALLQEHKGQDVSLLDLRGINNWTDFFVIATVSSRTHMDGLERHIREFCHEKDIEIFGSSRTRGSGTKSLRTKGSHNNIDDDWRLIDLGSVIVHLMTSSAREFYDLERLWRPTLHAKHVDC